MEVGAVEKEMLNSISCVVITFVAYRGRSSFDYIAVGECGVADSQSCEDSFFVSCILVAGCEVAYFWLDLVEVEMWVHVPVGLPKFNELFVYVGVNIFQWAGDVIAGGKIQAVFGEFIGLFVSSDTGMARDPEEFGVWGSYSGLDYVVDGWIC